jgi:adenylyl-sulfate kinase
MAQDEVPAGAAGAEGHAGCVVWFTGRPGAGKSTLSQRVDAELRGRGVRTEILDGDTVREHLSCDLGFSREDRDSNVRRVGYVADLLARNGVVVIAAMISPYRETRNEVRTKIGDRFIEVYIDASVEACAERDVKGHYAKALAGEIENFTGISDPYEEPLAPEILISTENETVEQSTAKIVSYVDVRVGVPA